MKKRSLGGLVTIAAMCAILTMTTTPAAAQARGEQPRKPKPTVGAWWYKGDPQPPGPHPDLTGVWFGGSINDISKDVLAGQQLILTPYGEERYKKVDHAKDPNAQCLPPGPTRMTARRGTTPASRRSCRTPSAVSDWTAAAGVFPSRIAAVLKARGSA